MKEKDEVDSSLKNWTTELTAALLHAGYGCEYIPSKVNKHFIGQLNVHSPKNEYRCYTIRFERKVNIVKDERTFLTSLEVWNPDGQLHVHIHKFSPETVQRIVRYVQTTFDNQAAKEQKRANCALWEQQSIAILQKELADFQRPNWVIIGANCQSEQDVGTFYLSFLRAAPLSRMRPAQIKQTIIAIQNIANGQGDWQPASVPIPQELSNDPTQPTDNLKKLLLAVPFYEEPVIGWYFGGLLNEFRIEGSPSAQEPTHWMPLPSKPKSA